VCRVENPGEHGTVLRAPLDPVVLGSLPPDDADTVVRDPAQPFVPDAVDDEDEPDPPSAQALRFRVWSGDEALVLDEDVHIGRNPRPPLLDAGRPVRLLRVKSPQGVISASHLGLRRVGSTAVVADLLSTNGTLVFLPGFPPRRLRRGETLAAPPGPRLEIGEGIVIEVIRPGGLD
jgi:hypothetical protein